MIRPATAADQETIKTIVREAGINPFNLDWPRFLVMEEDGRIIGVGQVKPHSDGSRELASIAVIPERRGEGVGSALIKALLERENGVLYLFCRSGLETYYRRFGFQKVGRDELQPSMGKMYTWGNLFMKMTSPLSRRKMSFIAMKRKTH